MVGMKVDTWRYKFLQVHECGKIVQGASIDPFGGELDPKRMAQADSKSFDERKQTEPVRVSEWPRPIVLLVRPGYGLFIVGCKGVMEMGDSSNVPWIRCQGACKEGVNVVDEAGSDHFHKFLRKLSDWGRACGRCLRVTSAEQPLDIGFASVPKFVDKQFTRCGTTH